MSEPTQRKECPHNVIRKKRTADEHQYETEKYVCGSCAQLFDVTPYEKPKPHPKEPMFPKNPIPWGLRGRQA